MRTKEPKGMGRPLIKIDWKKVKKLCSIQCTGEEIASVLEISYDTLQRALEREKKTTFAEYFKKNSGGGRASLRRRQFEAALAGNPALMIWLGKQYLGQEDKMDVNAKTKNTHEHKIRKLSPEEIEAAKKAFDDEF